MLFDTIRTQILDSIALHLKSQGNETTLPDLVLEYPPELHLGDFAFPAFRLAKMLRKGPPQIAKDLAEHFKKDALLSKNCKIEAVGPYVNFTVNADVLKTEVLKSLLLSGEHLGEQKQKNPPTIILEYSSPNVAKAFNIYHLRGTMIGSCLYHIFKTRGYNTIGINHLGDWGTQYGTLAVAYEKWGDDHELEKRGIPYLVELYIKINKEMETDKNIELQARATFAKLEKGDAAIQKLWKKFVELSLKEFNRTYQRLHVEFDHVWGESFYIDKISAVEKLLKEKNLIVESEGAQVVMLETFNMPPCMIRKADGSTIYHTRDLAAAIYRQEKFHFSKMVYVVGAEQKLHFAQIFKTLELAGQNWSKVCVHVDFGLYRFGDAKMSTRKGNFFTMESVLDEAVERVETIMREKWTEASAAELKTAAEAIGVGAVIFNDLSTDRNTDVNFDLEKVLDFEGETGPYIQYAHTRCLSILRNAPESLVPGLDRTKLMDLSANAGAFKNLVVAAEKKLKETEELDLIRVLAKFPLILDSVLETYRPSHLTSYLIDITKAFNRFYRAHKVLVEEEALAQARLSLVLATERVLLKGLTLLGMSAPEKM